MSQQFAKIQVETAYFPPSVNPLGSSRTLFLRGAGGSKYWGEVPKAIGLYMEDGAVPFLAAKWKGKTAAELSDSAEFIRDVVSAPFERFVRVRMILPLTGIQCSEKVVENCIGYWKSIVAYTDAEAAAVENFLEVYRDETFPPGASILFAQLRDGSTTVVFTKDLTIPETGKAVIAKKKLSDAIVESIIGLNGVSPAARQSLASSPTELSLKIVGTDEQLRGWEGVTMNGEGFKVV